jgi:hypothetical protein
MLEAGARAPAWYVVYTNAVLASNGSGILVSRVVSRTHQYIGLAPFVAG